MNLLGFFASDVDAIALTVDRTTLVAMWILCNRGRQIISCHMLDRNWISRGKSDDALLEVLARMAKDDNQCDAR